MNEEVMQMLPVENATYLSADAFKCDNVEEAENSSILWNSTIPSHHLDLNVGCFIMLLCNLALQKGQSNFSRLEIINLHPNCVEVKLTSVPNSGNRVLLPE